MRGEHAATTAAGLSRPRPPPVAVSERNDKGIRLVQETGGSLKIQISYSPADSVNRVAAPHHRGSSGSQRPSRGRFQPPASAEQLCVGDQIASPSSQHSDVQIPAGQLHESEDVPHFDQQTVRERGQGGTYRRGLRRGEWRRSRNVAGMTRGITGRPVCDTSTTASVKLDDESDFKQNSSDNTRGSKTLSTGTRHPVLVELDSTEQSQHDTECREAKLRVNNSRSGYGRVRLARGGGSWRRPYSPRRGRGSYRGGRGDTELVSEMTGASDTAPVESNAVEPSQLVVEDWEAEILPVDTKRHKEGNSQGEKFVGVAVDQLNARNTPVLGKIDNVPTIGNASLESHQVCGVDVQNSECALVKKVANDDDDVAQLNSENYVEEASSELLVQDDRSKLSQTLDIEDAHKSFIADMRPAVCILLSSDLQPAETIGASKLPTSQSLPVTSSETSMLSACDVLPGTSNEASKLPSSDLMKSNQVPLNNEESTEKDL